MTQRRAVALAGAQAMSQKLAPTDAECRVVAGTCDMLLESMRTIVPENLLYDSGCAPACPCCARAFKSSYTCLVSPNGLSAPSGATTGLSSPEDVKR